MARPLNISTARRTLPALFDRVTKRQGEKVVIRRRDGVEEAVLVSGGYLERLERGPRFAAPTSFRLFGSGTLVAPVDEVIDEVRAAEAAESKRRARTLVAAARRRARR